MKLTVPETDDPNMPALTFRTWTLGIILCAFLSFVNQFFFFRTAPITISAIAGQMASLYLGRFMAQVLPDKKILGIRINPGPFNIKVPNCLIGHHLDSFNFSILDSSPNPFFKFVRKGKMLPGRNRWPDKLIFWSDLSPVVS